MGVHYDNYTDFSVWDMLFGTFRNSREFRGECGFEAGADRKMGAMFAFADVNAPEYGAGSLGAKPRGLPKRERRGPPPARMPDGPCSAVTTLGGGAPGGPSATTGNSRDNCIPIWRNQP
jgi:hypothetical protein